jgi:hypothetical protein
LPELKLGPTYYVQIRRLPELKLGPT